MLLQSHLGEDGVKLLDVSSDSSARRFMEELSASHARIEDQAILRTPVLVVGSVVVGDWVEIQKGIESEKLLKWLRPVETAFRRGEALAAYEEPAHVSEALARVSEHSTGACRGQLSAGKGHVATVPWGWMQWNAVTRETSYVGDGELAVDVSRYFNRRICRWS